MSSERSFPPDERQRIQQALAEARSPMVCPRCGRDLSVAMPVAGGRHGAPNLAHPV